MGHRSIGLQQQQMNDWPPVRLPGAYTPDMLTSVWNLMEQGPQSSWQNPVRLPAASRHAQSCQCCHHACLQGRLRCREMTVSHVTSTTGMQWPCPATATLSVEQYALHKARGEVTRLACDYFSLADSDGILKVHHCLLPVRASAPAMFCLDVSLRLIYRHKWTALWQQEYPGQQWS